MNLLKRPNSPQRSGLLDYPFDVHLGVNRLGDRLSTPPDYYWQLQNCYVSKDNWVEQRNGFTRVTDSALTGAPKIRKLFEIENSTGGRTVICRGGTRWARLNGTSWTDLDTGRGSDLYGQIAQFNNEFYMADGGTLRKSTMAFSVSTVSGTNIPTKVSAVHTHNHRLVINDDDNPMNILVSKVDSVDFDTTGNDAIIINASKLIPGGDKVIGYSTYLQTYLVVWMRRNILIYNLPTTTSDVSLQQVISGTGCLSYDGVTPVGKDLWFPSDMGWKKLAYVIGNPNVVDMQEVSHYIGPYWRSALSSLTDVRDIQGVYYQPLDHFYNTLPFSSAHEVWCFSPDLDYITKGKGNIAGGPWTGITAYSFVYTKGRVLYFGGSDGHLYQMDDGTNDNGTTIIFTAEKTGLYFGNPKIFKAPREFEGLFQATASLTATISYSYETTGLNTGQLTNTITINTQSSVWDVALWDVSYWDVSGSVLFKSRNLTGRGKVMNILVTHNTMDAQLKFRNWIISLTMQGDK